MELLGDQIQTKVGVKPKTECLAGKKYVGLYFSAHWCPPCRKFTPILAEFYKNVKARDDSLLEIIFISSDKDQAAFDEYYGEMTWCALNYSERDMKEKISGKYGIRGIPTFVLLDAAGNTLDANARGKVQDDDTGKKFPWGL